MKTSLLTLLLLTLGTAAFAEELSLEEAFSFRQQELLLEDALSDQALITRVAQAKKNIGLRLLGKPIEIPEGQSYEERGVPEKKEEQIRLEGLNNPYKHKGFNNMFLQVIEEERVNGISPSVGEFHRWSPETNTAPVLGMSKILTALALGITYRVMYTGQEEALKNFLLSKEDKSVHFHEFFRKAYTLNHGNVYLALLSMENLLAINWKAPHRDNIPHFKKLTPLLSSYNGGGDNYGSYYHFIGIMLYGYVHGNFAARFVGATEALGSKILSRFEAEVQENLANFNGGKIGRALRKSMENLSSSKFQADKNHLNVTSYLDHTEDFRDRLPITPSEELKLSIFDRLTSSEDHRAILRNTGADLYGCTLEIYVKSFRKGRTTKETIKADLLKDRSVVIPLISFGSTPSVRIFVSDCQESDFSGAIQDRHY